MHFNLDRFRTCRLPVTGNSKLRVAQLTAGFSFDSAELFLPDRWKCLQASAPNVLIGSAADLQRLVERIDIGTIEVDTLDHSIYVLTAVGDRPLTDVLRVVLWQRFGVPIFELYTYECGVLAYECEAHEGWHIEAGSRLRVVAGELVLGLNGDGSVRTGLNREIDSQPCACGRSGTRIVESLDQWRDRPFLAAIA
jgi:hypothetical protein